MSSDSGQSNNVSKEKSENSKNNANHGNTHEVYEDSDLVRSKEIKVPEESLLKKRTNSNSSIEMERMNRSADISKRAVKFHKVTKIYKNSSIKVLDKVSFDIKEGEFMILVGPSGCGKSTCLRLLAGLEKITSGSIYIQDKKVNDLPPKDRNITMVFQSYALFPHMTIYENLAFGLKIQKIPKEEIDKKVKEIASLLGLMDHLQKKPGQLSGGQRQRVALGRAIIRKADVFLLDEPLSNLDAKLRAKMRAEIKRIQRKFNVATLYVTHDQVEAMTMGDRIAILNGGIIQQVGTPHEIYNTPKNMFVAGFIGSPQMNFLPLKIMGKAGSAGNIGINDKEVKTIGDNFIKLPSSIAKVYTENETNQIDGAESSKNLEIYAKIITTEQELIKFNTSTDQNVSNNGKINDKVNNNVNEKVNEKINPKNQFELYLGVRPEDVLITRLETNSDTNQNNTNNSESGFLGTIELIEPIGPYSIIHINFANQLIICQTPLSNLETGQQILIKFNEDKLHFFDSKTGLNISPKIINQ